MQQFVLVAPSWKFATAQKRSEWQILDTEFVSTYCQLILDIHLFNDKKSNRLLGAQMFGNEGLAHRIHTAKLTFHGHMSFE